MQRSLLRCVPFLLSVTLASAQSRGHVAQCLNNLRQMGRAVHVWAGDYQNQPPWRTLQQDGGLMPAVGTRAGNAWSDLVIMSNALVTPRILSGRSRVFDGPGFPAILVAPISQQCHELHSESGCPHGVSKRVPVWRSECAVNPRSRSLLIKGQQHRGFQPAALGQSGLDQFHSRLERQPRGHGRQRVRNVECSVQCGHDKIV